MLSLATLGTQVTRVGGRLLLVGKKYAPQIMVYTGVAGFIGTVIYACKATTKAEEILKERDEKMAKVQECAEDESIEYSEETREEDIRIITAQTRWKLVKAYAPVVTLCLASTALVLGGYHIISVRSASYAAAYKASEKAFRAYRNAVAKKYGEDPNKTILDEQIPEVLEAERLKEEGDEKPKKKKLMPVQNDINTAVFSRKTSRYWQTNAPRLNCYFLKKVQEDCNNELMANGYIFLNTVRGKLGLNYIPEGQYVGWILSKHGDGDNFVDFLHIDDPLHEPSQSVKDFFDLRNTDNVVLDFNHDGDIHMDVRMFA